MENIQSFVDVFASHEVPEVIQLFARIYVKKHNICKPKRHQRSIHSGHKRVHCVKHQTLVTLTNRCPPKSGEGKLPSSVVLVMCMLLFTNVFFVFLQIRIIIIIEYT